MRAIALVSALVVAAPLMAIARPAPRAIVIATPHDERADRSEVRWLEIGASAARVVHAVTIPHAPGAVVRGDVLPGTDAAVVVCDDDAARDPEYGAALLRVDAAGARQLATGLVHASRPLASADGQVYVERGARGPQRVDALGIDAIDPVSGASRAVVSWSGFALHLAGESGGALVVYRVGPGGAEIVLVDRASGSVRVASAVPPFARDFSVDAARGAVVMANRDDADSHLWTVERVDLATGARARLHEERDDAPAPFALPSGDALWTAPRRAGLFALGKTFAPLGPGFDSVRAVTDDGALALVAHVPSAGWDAAAVVELASGRAFALPADVRVEPVGFVGARAVLR